MASQWYYARNGVRFGPVSGQQLKQLAATGELLPQDLLWKEGLPDWRPARAAKGLFPAPQAASVPPPLPPTTPVQVCPSAQSRRMWARKRTSGSGSLRQ
jgi:hypothetical protein